MDIAQSSLLMISRLMIMSLPTIMALDFRLFALESLFPRTILIMNMNTQLDSMSVMSSLISQTQETKKKSSQSSLRSKKISSDMPALAISLFKIGLTT